MLGLVVGAVDEDEVVGFGHGCDVVVYFQFCFTGLVGIVTGVRWWYLVGKKAIWHDLVKKTTCILLISRTSTYTNAGNGFVSWSLSESVHTERLSLSELS